MKDYISKQKVCDYIAEFVNHPYSTDHECEMVESIICGIKHMDEENFKNKIVIDKTTLKGRGAGYVFYNLDYLKKNFMRESKLIMSEPYIPMSLIENIKTYIHNYIFISEKEERKLLGFIDRKVDEVTDEGNT